MIGLTSPFWYIVAKEIHFITFALVEWVDVFTRKGYDILSDSIKNCAEKYWYYGNGVLVKKYPYMQSMDNICPIMKTTDFHPAIHPLTILTINPTVR